MGLQIHANIEDARRKSGFKSFLGFFSSSTGRLCLACLAFTLILVYNLPAFAGVDYFETFRPAADLLLRGESPYSVLYNPPWVLIPFIPLSFLPIMTAYKVWLIISAGLFLLAMVRMKTRPLAILIFFLSPPVLFSMLCGNVEALVVLGFTLPPTWGLFLVLLKPQLGFGVAVFWAVEVLRKEGLPGFVKVFAPVTGAFLLSMVVFGFWPGRMGLMLNHASNVNLSLWPLSLPFGLALLYLSLRKHNIHLAMMVAPLISPYSLLYSWTGFIAGLTPKWWQALIGTLPFWILCLISILHS